VTSHAPTLLVDLDGTLIDSAPGILASVQAALRALGHAAPTTFDVASLIGPPIEDGMRALLAPLGDSRIADGVEAYRAAYRETGVLNGRLYPGVTDALARLMQDGAQLLLATSKRLEFAERILDHFHVRELFDGVFDAAPGGALDHKAALIAHVINVRALTPSRCVMIGDRRYDVAGAKANHIASLGVLWGYGDRAELDAAGADAVIARPEDLVAAALALVGGA